MFKEPYGKTIENCIKKVELKSIKNRAEQHS